MKKVNLRSGDRSRCNTEWLKEGGDEMIDKVQQQYSTGLRMKDRYRYNGEKHQESHYTKEKKKKLRKAREVFS